MKKITVATSKLIEKDTDYCYEEAEVEILEPTLNYTSIYRWIENSENSREVEVWVEGKCAKCGRDISFYVFFSDENGFLSDVVEEECDCGVFSWTGYCLTAEDERVFEELLNEKGIERKLDLNGRFYRYYYKKKRE
jgi:hypothetical protein